MKSGFAILVLFVTGPLLGVAESWDRVEPIPQRLPVVRDRLGYSWQLTAAGSFYSSGGNVFDSANQVSIHGDRFVAERMEKRGERYAFTGRCGTDWGLRREVWIDPERAAAFHLEEVRNESAERREVLLELATHFRTPWRDWSARDGRAQITGALQAAAGAFLSFPPREGDSDLFFLLGDGRGDVGVQIEAAEQTFTARYRCELEPGATLRILHCAGQRRPGPGESLAANVFAPFFQGEQLIASGVAGKLANFAEPVADSGAGVIWTRRNGEEVILSQPCREEVTVTGALGRARFRCDEMVRFDGRTWITRDGFKVRGVALPGQVLHAVTPIGAVEIAVEDLRGIRGAAEPVKIEGGLRLKNGDIWPGRRVGESNLFVQWETQSVVREVPKGWIKEGKDW